VLVLAINDLQQKLKEEIIELPTETNEDQRKSIFLKYKELVKIK
jgi:hypothetical protein